MGAYDFLSDVVVLEVAQLGPDSLGQLLADMGAQVIKVETPGEGDPVRRAGPYAVGEPDGFGYMHLRWNRGKRSVALDLRTARGRQLFADLAAKADVVIEGMRAGVLERLGLGYEALKGINPALVFCSLSGMGSSGPYATMASHGPSFDCFGGLAQAPASGNISKWTRPQPPPIGMYAMGQAAAVGVLSALHRARRTGQGARLEIAAAECAAHWLPEPVDEALNRVAHHRRPGFADARGRMLHWPRMDNYRAKDGRVLYIMILYDKYWKRFAELVDRPDLLSIYVAAPSAEAADDRVADALTEIFRQRSRAEWIEFLQAHDVPVMPVNTTDDLLADPHFKARDNTYQASLGDSETLTLMGTPIRTAGQPFAPRLAPELGQDTDAVLSGLAGLTKEAIAELRADGVIV